MKYYSPHIFLQKAKRNGLPEESIKQAIAYSNKLIANKMPVIYSLKHFSLITGTNYKYLRRIVKRYEDPYSIFQMRKRSGGIRNICIPSPSIAQAQKFISKHILSNLLPNSRSYAYHPGNSIIDCCRQHCAAKWIIKIDIQQFFENISELKIFKEFHNIGYTKLLSLELARICTRISDKRKNISFWQVSKINNYTVIPTYYSNRIGSLPQGASTSPMLSNIVCQEMDSTFTSLMEKEGIIYTRYADDMTFSSSSGIKNRDDAKKIISKIYEVIFSYGFRPKTTKTKILPPGSKKIVLGLNVDGEEPKLLKEFKYRIEKHLHCIEKYGLLEYSMHIRFRDPLSFYEHLLGLINYAVHVEPDFGMKCKNRLTLMKLFNEV
ncbi:reverse transcriptase family protein [Leptospira sp. 85282-16]|uniref:reverse transcriptase family protein n=1 Tax=Leptospira sp. 85282-16 TaxID=2971256 RepID=UPI0021C06342|nr:reverse transcriptase family protein [Leptospira sp. 85282-16]MCT8335843.1 reverse transcriptase family protein [Leptospira sp. 85282-16]